MKQDPEVQKAIYPDGDMATNMPEPVKDKQPLRILALAVAISQIGVEEIPKNSNSGPDVEMFLKSVGLGKGYSWCMAFLYWCFMTAAKEAGLVNALIKTGGCMAQWNRINAQYKSQEPQIGSLVIFDHGGGNGHVAIIEKIEGDQMHTVEGNTNDEGSREGYEVCRRIRKMSDPKIKGYITV